MGTVISAAKYLLIDNLGDQGVKKKFLVSLIILSMLFCTTGCVGDAGVTVTVPVESEPADGESEDDEPAKDNVSFTYTADFYDNFGGRWFSAEGKTFSIKPNKIKTYGFDSDGSWISSYEMSSVVSIEIDGSKIESCGSTVIFADSRLKKCDIDFEEEIRTEEAKNTSQEASISQPADVRVDDWWKIQNWWYQKSLNNKEKNSRLVMVQSQLGNPICVYSGDDVSWDIPKNLPNTTLVTIDGKVLYIHRANFSIIDMDIIPDHEN